jgi:undecaprenyl-diphosphatase
MELIEAVIIGIIQGVTEWLPISSEAAITLIMTQVFGTGPEKALNASIFLHTGTMIAAFIYFRQEYLEILKYVIEQVKTPVENLQKPEKVLQEKEGRLTIFLAVSTFLTAVVGGTIYFTGIKTAVKNPAIFYLLMSAALFITGLLRLYKKSKTRKHSSVEISDSVFVGFLQGFSIIPGVSRSGTTAFGFLFRDFDARSAFHLSFLMSVPAILAGNIGLELFTSFNFEPVYLAASAAAAITGYITIESVLEIADRAEIAWICFALAIIALIPAII